MRIGLTLAAAALTLLPTAALAHPGHGPQGLLHGFAHPPGSIDHTMAIVTVGMLAFMVATVGLYAARTAIRYASRLIASTRAT